MSRVPRTVGSWVAYNVQHNQTKTVTLTEGQSTQRESSITDQGPQPLSLRDSLSRERRDRQAPTCVDGSSVRLAVCHCAARSDPDARSFRRDARRPTRVSRAQDTRKKEPHSFKIFQKQNVLFSFHDLTRVPHLGVKLLLWSRGW